MNGGQYDPRMLAAEQNLASLTPQRPDLPTMLAQRISDLEARLADLRELQAMVERNPDMVRFTDLLGRMNY